MKLCKNISVKINRISVLQKHQKPAKNAVWLSDSYLQKIKINKGNHKPLIVVSQHQGKASDRLQRKKLNFAGFFRDKFAEKPANLMGFSREFSR